MKNLWMVGAAAVLLSAACARVKVDPVKIEPIYITMDIRIRIDRQLDDFFAFEDSLKSPAANPTPSSNP